ncbi:hypothetical protein pb186bvf_015861 [Paramecium bursaria]
MILIQQDTNLLVVLMFPNIISYQFDIYQLIIDQPLKQICYQSFLIIKSQFLGEINKNKDQSRVLTKLKLGVSQIIIVQFNQKKLDNNLKMFQLWNNQSCNSFKANFQSEVLDLQQLEIAKLIDLISNQQQQIISASLEFNIAKVEMKEISSWMPAKPSIISNIRSSKFSIDKTKNISKKNETKRRRKNKQRCFLEGKSQSQFQEDGLIGNITNIQAFQNKILSLCALVIQRENNRFLSRCLNQLGVEQQLNADLTIKNLTTRDI